MKLIEIQEMAEKIANDLVGENFEPAHNSIPYWRFTELIESYLDYYEKFESTEEDILLIRKYLIKNFCKLVNDNTQYKAEIEWDYINNQKYLIIYKD